MQEQSFTETSSAQWINMEKFPGTRLLALAQPVSEGSIHLLKMKAGTEIPPHTHPCDEYVYVLSGIIKTGEKTCDQGTFWFTPAHTRQGSHQAITDVEIMTIRLGKMGVFESSN